MTEIPFERAMEALGYSHRVTQALRKLWIAVGLTHIDVGSTRLTLQDTHDA